MREFYFIFIFKFSVVPLLRMIKETSTCFRMQQRRRVSVKSMGRMVCWKEVTTTQRGTTSGIQITGIYGVKFCLPKHHIRRTVPLDEEAIEVQGPADWPVALRSHVTPESVDKKTVERSALTAASFCRVGRLWQKKGGWLL